MSELASTPYVEVDDLLEFVSQVLRTTAPKDPRRALKNELERRGCLQTVFGRRKVALHRLQAEWMEMWMAWDAKQAEAKR